MSYVVSSALSFAWPDDTPVFEDLSFSVPGGRTGLVAPNGAGKSTLLRLVAGELTPTGGSITVQGGLGYLPQHLPFAQQQTVAQVLEVDHILAALHAIEAGDAAEEHFTTIGNDRDIEERTRAELDRLGLADVALDRRLGTLSGGQVVSSGSPRNCSSDPTCCCWTSRELQQARERAARRASTASRNLADAGLARIVAGNLKRDAQVSAAKANEVHAARAGDAQARLDQAGRAARQDDTIVLELPQRLDLLDPERTVLENLSVFAPALTEAERMNLLARFLFRGARAHLPVSVLSGGELLQATLACILFAQPAPQLLLLDEPTNNLDLVSVGQLESALTAYRGAFVVVSHDDRFLAGIEVDRRLLLTDGHLSYVG